MGTRTVRKRRIRLGRTTKFVFTAALMALAAISYYQVQGSHESWRQLLKDSPALVLTGTALFFAVSRLAAIWLGPLRRPKRLPDGSLVFARSRLGKTWSAMSGILVTGIGVAVLVGWNPDRTTLGIGLGMLALVFGVSVYQLLRPQGPVTLSPEGIVGADRRHPLIAWREIESLALDYGRYIDAITITLASPPDSPATVTRGSKSKKPVRINITPSDLGADPDVLMDALEDFRSERAAHPGNTNPPAP